jgi:hypothetical protein
MHADNLTDVSRRRPNAIIGKNQQLWDLGMDAFGMEDKTMVQEKIR